MLVDFIGDSKSLHSNVHRINRNDFVSEIYRVTECSWNRARNTSGKTFRKPDAAVRCALSIDYFTVRESTVARLTWQKIKIIKVCKIIYNKVKVTGRGLLLLVRCRPKASNFTSRLLPEIATWINGLAWLPKRGGKTHFCHIVNR